MHRTLCRWTTALTLGVLVAATAAAQDAFPLDEVERGQRGYGLSVFQGTEPERFEFEVIGVWRNVQPGASFILAEFSGQGLEETGVIAGMSGSPVYIGERLVGAVAFAWPFSKQPIGGITPIESMRELLDAHSTGATTPMAATPIELADIVGQSLDESVLVDSLARLRPEPVGGAQVGVQWLAAGFGAESRRLLSSGLGHLASAGAGQSDATFGELAPGSSVSGVLVDGDHRLAATGTVTDRIDNRILAFGHAFLGLGSLRLPMATSEVLTVLPSQANSFKVANLGNVVGAFDLDHSAGFRGEVGAEAPTIPVRVNLNGRNPQVVNLRIAELPQLSSALLAISVLGALEVDPEASGSKSIRMDARFGLGELGALDVRQSFDGPSAAIEMVLHLFAVTGFLQQNTLAEVDIERVDVELEWASDQRLTEIVGAFASRTLVEPGDKLDVAVELKSFRGESFRRTIEVELPPDLPAGRFSLLVGDGVSIDGARLSVEQRQPARISQALDLLGSLHSRRELLVLGLFPGQGISVPGAVLPRLPGSVRSLWAAAPHGGVEPLQLTLSEHGSEELDVPLSGLVRVDLRVERPKPWSGESAKPTNQGRSD